MSEFEASIVITTRNRANDLRRALTSCVGQEGDIETIVIDDSSDDNTPNVVAAEFPQVRLIRTPARSGYIVARNLAARQARAPVIVSIDDDAIFTATDAVRRTLADLAPPEVAAVAIPHEDVIALPGHLYNRPPDVDHVYLIDQFIGTAHAIKREAFLAVGGYRENLVHMGEERDLCLRLLDQGWAVRMGTASPIHHFTSPARENDRVAYYTIRNRLLFGWQNLPLRYVLPHWASNVRHSLKVHWRSPTRRATVRGIFAGIGDALLGRAPRSPVSRQAYDLHRLLKRNQAATLDDLALRVAALRSNRRADPQARA